MTLHHDLIRRLEEGNPQWRELWAKLDAYPDDEPVTPERYELFLDALMLYEREYIAWYADQVPDFPARVARAIEDLFMKKTIPHTLEWQRLIVPSPMKFFQPVEFVIAMTMIRSGMSERDVARFLCRSPNTVSDYCSPIIGNLRLSAHLGPDERARRVCEEVARQRDRVKANSSMVTRQHP
jgi:hypothetical protein